MNSLSQLAPQQALALASVKQFPGRTSAELADATGGRGQFNEHLISLRRRLPELHRLGLIMRDNDARYWPV